MNLSFMNGLSEAFIFFGILVLTVLTASLFRYFFGRFIRRSTKLMYNDPTNYKYLKHALTGLIYVIGISWAIYRIESLRAVANSLLAGAGIIAIVVGFASQHALSNVISGLFIVIFKPFRVNDRVSLISSDQHGTIEDITLRHVVIRDYQNRRIVIPNAIISDEVIVNGDMIDARVARWVEFGISYDSDVDKAKRIIREEVLKHPLYIDGRTEEQIANGMDAVPIRLIGFGDSSVNLRASAWAGDPINAFTLACDIRETVKKRFDAEGVEIPFPYRTIVYKKDLEEQDTAQPDGSLHK